MRAAYEHIEATQDASWTGYLRREPRFPFTWHYHHEYELTSITGGRGTRFVGDSIEEYQLGDLTLIGPDLPHTYASEPDGRQEAVVVQFRGDFLGTGFFDRPEFAEVAALLAGSARGVRFEAAESLTGLLHLPPAQRTLSLLRTLVRLTEVDHRPLASEHYRPALNHAAGERIDAVMAHLHARYTEPLTLAEIAGAAHMAPAAVSRFFRRTTGTTITDYLNALRIGAACRLLADDTDRRIADIAAACGYHNLAHFNRRFLALKGITPRAYRARFSRPHRAPP